MERFIGDLGEFAGFQSGNEANREENQEEGEDEDTGHPAEACTLPGGEGNARAALVEKDSQEPAGDGEAEDAKDGESCGLRERDKDQHSQSGYKKADADGAGVGEADFADLFRQNRGGFEGDFFLGRFFEERGSGGGGFERLVTDRLATTVAEARVRYQLRTATANFRHDFRVASEKDILTV